MFEPHRAFIVASGIFVSLLLVSVGLAACADWRSPESEESPSEVMRPSTPALPTGQGSGKLVSATAVLAPPDLGCLIYGDGAEGEPTWLLEGGHLPRAMSGEGWPYPSPGGRSAVRIRGFPNEIWLATSDGLREEKLYTAPAGSPLVAYWNWAPDGRMGVFSFTAPGSPASQEPGDLWRLDVPAGTAKQLVEEGAHWPLFSPDSQWLSTASPLGTLVSHGSVGLINIEGQGDPAILEQVHVWDRAWAADSSGFVVAVEEPAPVPIRTELWWIPTEGEPTELGQLTYVAELLWQPGGERLIYRKWVGEGPAGTYETTRLYLAWRDGGEEVAIPESEDLHATADTQLPSWSPDGRWLLTMDAAGAFFLVDTREPGLHPLGLQALYGWLDPDHYLASYIEGEELEEYHRGEDIYVGLYRCSPPEDCQFLAQMSRMGRVSYSGQCP